MSLRANKRVGAGLLYSQSASQPLPQVVNTAANAEVLFSASSVEKNNDPNVIKCRDAIRQDWHTPSFTQAKAIAATLKGKHVFCGAETIMSDGTPFVMMTAMTSALFKACLRKSALSVSWQCRDTPYGKVYRLSAGPNLTAARAFLPAQGAAYAAFIRTGRVGFAISHGGQVTDAFVADFSDDPLRLAMLHQGGSNSSHSEFLFEDTDLAYWWLMAFPDTEWSALISRRPQDTLQTDWAFWVTHRVQHFAAMVTKMRALLADRPLSALYATDNLPEKHPHFYRLIEAVHTGASLGEILHLAGRSLESPDAALDMLTGTNMAWQWHDNRVARMVIHALRLSWYVHSATNCGRRRPWFDRRGENVIPSFIELDPVSLGRNAHNYWRDVDLNWPIDHGMFINGTDLPADIVACKRMLSELPLVDSQTDVVSLIGSLLAEAREHKQWTVPPGGARIELGIAAFPFVDLYEIGASYWCVLRNPENRYFLAMADLDNGTIEIPNATFTDDKYTNTTSADHTLRIILAGIIRDFVVTERRELVFAVRPGKDKVTRGQRSSGQFATHIYLPRVSFGSIGNLASAKADFSEFQPRAKHSVSGRLRRCENPSAHQRMLAQRDGVTLLPGMTYVHPHFRGDKECEQVRRSFRSRSVCQMLFPVAKDIPDGPTEWFDFERKIHRFLQASKLEIMSTSSPRSHCVDICAVDHRRNTPWMIRFMLLPAHKYVGTDAIRDIVEKLDQNLGHPKAMIVTTSGFTAQAIVDAKALGVEHVNGMQLAIATASV